MKFFLLLFATFVITNLIFAQQINSSNLQGEWIFEELKSSQNDERTQKNLANINTNNKGKQSLRYDNNGVFWVKNETAIVEGKWKIENGKVKIITQYGEYFQKVAIKNDFLIIETEDNKTQTIYKKKS
jgi:hypothetical protein